MRRTQLAVLAATMAVALGIWWWQRPGAPTEATSPKVAPPAGVTAEGGRGPGSAPTTAQEAAPLIDDDPRGTLRLEGQVIDAEGLPVNGAVVALSANPPRTATSEEDGGFAFDALVGRPYTLTARAKAGVAGPVTARLTAHSEPIILQLRPGAEVAVTVVDSKAAPIAGATVELRGFDLQTAQSGGDGRAVFTAVVQGRYELAAWGNGYAKVHQDLGVGGKAVDARVVLVKGAAVSGRVVDSGGRAVEGARVLYASASDWAEGDERRDGVVTAADGGFRFDALPAGSFRFIARHPKHAPGTSALVTLDGSTARDGVEVKLELGATVRGKVVDVQGAPVASARVRLAARRDGMFDAGPRQVYSGEDGSFELGGVPRQPLQLVALHETATSALRDVDASGGDVDGVELRLDVTGTIAGVVVDAEGEPIEGAQVAAWPDLRGGDFSQLRLRGRVQELTDAGGRFRLTGLAEGSYSVQASRSRFGGRRGGFGGFDTPTTRTGTLDLRLVLPAEGGVKGKVAFADGTAPTAFTVSVGFNQESFSSATGSFSIEGLAPEKQQLSLRGPTFDTRTVDVTVPAGDLVDLGTITVSKGRTLAGRVLNGTSPVAGATVYAARQLFGSGSSPKAQGGFGGMARGTREATTDEDGAFSLTGFGRGDITLVAEHPDLGRSKAVRVVTGDPREGEVVLAIEPFGALAGVLRTSGQVQGGGAVTVQSITAPAARFTVTAGPDGAFRVDRLAPDKYKVSASLGMPMRGMKFFSKDVEVLPGKETTVELAVSEGTASLVVAVVAPSGTVGTGSVWLVSGSLAARTSQELSLKMAAAGPGNSSWKILMGEPEATFNGLTPGGYTACAVPLPTEIRGMQAMEYASANADRLPAYCKGVNVQAASARVEIPVVIPAVVPEGT